MKIQYVGKKISLMLLLAAACTVICFCAWSAANGPIADFPKFTPVAGIEGVAVDKVGNVYTSVTGSEGVTIWKSSPAGENAFLADIGMGKANGLAVDAQGNIYAALAEGMDRGVYRVDRSGKVVLLPGTEQIVFANALAFDKQGNLYITESYSIDSESGYGPGGIWRIPRGGEAELWLQDSLLTGIGVVLGYPVGANGLAYFQGDLYVANTDKGLIVKIPVCVDGSPGQPEMWTALGEVPESPLFKSPFPVMGDGIALDVFGNVYVAVVSRLAIVKIHAADFSQETVAAYLPNPNDPLFAPLDTPASLAFGTGKGGRQDLFVTNLGWMSNIIPGPPWPGPGLVKIEAGVPGLPLP